MIRISDLSINNANIGVTSKDSSDLEIDNLKVTNSKIALLAYQRKLEYGPGIIKINSIIFLIYIFSWKLQLKLSLDP